eukprot:gene15634-17212_t
MNAEEFRKAGHELIDFVSDYLENTEKYDVLPNVDPGYLRQRLPETAPEIGEKWEQIFHDVEEHIFPGITHWQSPNFHAYYPSRTSYPSILGEVLKSAINCIGFSWISSPACTELETIVLDWIGEMIGLPKEFLAFPKESAELNLGGGSIQGSASEALFVCLLAAKGRILETLTSGKSEADQHQATGKLIAYQSDQTHFAFVKGCKVLGIKQRTLVTNEKHQLEGPTLEAAIKEDKENGLIPFFLTATLGTTGTCAFDRILELGPICKDNGVWMHVDAAYAGLFYTCPENRETLKGVEYADSFNTNASKSLFTNFDASLLWVKKIRSITNVLSISASIMSHKYEGLVLDYKDMQLPLGRGFRALKLWFIVRTYGINALRDTYNKVCDQAKLFKSFVLADDRFELLDQKLGLVTFRVKGSNELNDAVNKLITEERRIFITPCEVKGKTILRFVVCYKEGNDDHIRFAWDVIKDAAHRILDTLQS